MANKNVNILLKLQDKFTSPMRDLGKITKDQQKAMAKCSAAAIDFSRNVRTGFVSAAKHVAAFGLAAGAATAAFATQAVKGYAEYEQLAGGVETLFKDSAKVVKQYAENAYQSAGLSANAYMETVTGFSASLLQSLGGDTAQAAKIADLAIVDMADNANKMGSAMESIQNAYQGFAKQNYTMLDNLKLGYGGTKEEMQRLLADAQKISGVEYRLDSFSDIVQAIHVIQTELAITGTTAKEAASTISGSIGMTKSAWKNLMAGLANPDADLDKLVDDVVTSAETAAENLIPVGERAVVGIFQAAKKLLPAAMSSLGKLAAEHLPPSILEGAEKVRAGIQTAWGYIQPVLSAAIQHADKLIPAALGVTAAISGISVVADIAQKVSGLASGFRLAASAGSGLFRILSGPLASGGKIAVTALKFLAGALTGPVGIAITAVTAGIILLYKHWDQATAFVLVLRDTVVSVFRNIQRTGIALKDQLIGAFTSAKEKVTGAFTAIRDTASAVLGKVKDFLQPVIDLINTIKSGLSGIGSGSSWGANSRGYVSKEFKALGTPYWKGGPVTVNERGGEILDLPSGTRIIPHDVSRKAAGARTVTVNLTVQGNVIGNRAFMEQTGKYIADRILAAEGVV